MKAAWVPHSEIPDWQRGHTEGEPDAVLHRLSELLPLIDTWTQNPPRT
jgi:putative hydrolase of the HAD superfamily